MYLEHMLGGYYTVTDHSETENCNRIETVLRFKLNLCYTWIVSIYLFLGKLFSHYPDCGCIIIYPLCLIHILTTYKSLSTSYH
jgi:hypothetical protein